MSFTFVVAVNNETVLRSNLLSSPCLQEPCSYQLILQRNATSVAEVYNAGIEQAIYPFVVCLHQDVHLPIGWPNLFLKRWQEAEEKFGPIDVAGVYGVGKARAGHVQTFGARLLEPEPLPVKVRSLDECLLVLPKTTTLRFDPALGFHFYGTDIALQAKTAVVLDAMCHHNSKPRLEDAFHKSQGVFAAKWRARGELPVQTSCVTVR